jgi:hypothetical protein
MQSPPSLEHSVPTVRTAHRPRTPRSSHIHPTPQAVTPHRAMQAQTDAGACATRPCMRHPDRSVRHPARRMRHQTPYGRRSSVWRADQNPHAPLATCRDATQASMWAKPCLAGRPTALVRTQCCEQNTSRGRPTGMELPDYPVMALTPSRRTRMGPHFTIPPGLFPDSYLVTLPGSHSLLPLRNRWV